VSDRAKDCALCLYVYIYIYICIYVYIYIYPFWQSVNVLDVWEFVTVDLPNLLQFWRLRRRPLKVFAHAKTASTVYIYIYIYTYIYIYIYIYIYRECSQARHAASGSKHRTSLDEFSLTIMPASDERPSVSRHKVREALRVKTQSSMLSIYLPTYLPTYTYIYTHLRACT
jgi:hypothetical protein